MLVHVGLRMLLLLFGMKIMGGELGRERTLKERKRLTNDGMRINENEAGEDLNYL